MKKMFALLVAVGLFFQSFAAVTVTEPKKKASEIFIPVGATGHKISLLDLSTVSLKEMEQLSGKKMKFAEKVSFKIGQHKLRQSISKDGTINNKRVAKAFNEGSGFNLGGFALGFFLGLIGVLIAYVIKDEKQSGRRKWAWIGWGTFLVLYLVLVLSVI
jgi:hypothetical protein